MLQGAMFTMRLTTKLLKRVAVVVDESPPPPTTRLGDWYGNILFVRPAQLVLFVNERTLLPVPVPAKAAAAPGSRARRDLEREPQRKTWRTKNWLS
jgi:hypothetical protein